MGKNQSRRSRPENVCQRLDGLEGSSEKIIMPAMRCNEVVISIALVLRREAAETEQMSHRGHSPVALRERRTLILTCRRFCGQVQYFVMWRFN
jgi:hypothetical protein